MLDSVYKSRESLMPAWFKAMDSAAALLSIVD